MGESRAQFDAEVTFRNGGRLTAEGFRLDIEGAEIDDEELGALFVRALGLLMVGTVRITNKRILREAHKGSALPQPAPSARRLVELSHRIEHGTITYPGLPGPEITDHLTREASRAHYAPGTEFQIGRISMVANTGTYLDTPSHRFAGGADLSGVGLQSLADLEGIVVRLGDGVGRAIDRELLLPYDVRGRAVVLHTGWDRHWGTPAYGGAAPFLTRAGASWLAEQGAALVGHRLAEHRRHRGPLPPRAHDPARRERPDRRAPLQPRPASCARLPLPRGPAAGARDGHVPGARLRRSRRVIRRERYFRACG